MNTERKLQLIHKIASQWKSYDEMVTPEIAAMMAESNRLVALRSERKQGAAQMRRLQGAPIQQVMGYVLSPEQFAKQDYYRQQDPEGVTVPRTKAQNDALHQSWSQPYIEAAKTQNARQARVDSYQQRNYSTLQNTRRHIEEDKRKQPLQVPADPMKRARPLLGQPTPVQRTRDRYFDIVNERNRLYQQARNGEISAANYNAEMDRLTRNERLIWKHNKPSQILPHTPAEWYN